MYSKIMVPLDGSELAECVLPHVEAIASGGQVTQVVLVRVVDPIRLPASVPARGDFGFREKDRMKLKEYLKAVAEEYLKKMVNTFEIKKANLIYAVLEGKAAHSIAEYATNNEVELIVIASHGRSGISRWVLGSVTEKVLRSAYVPVLMVRAPGCIPGI